MWWFFLSFFFFYCWQYSKPRQPAWSQWLILEGGREGWNFLPFVFTMYSLNFNSHLLVFFKVVYSSLLFLTPDCLWNDDASHLRVKKGTRHIASAFKWRNVWLFPVAVWGCYLRLLCCLRPYMPAFQAFFLANCLPYSCLHFLILMSFAYKLLIYWKFTEKFCQSYCHYRNFCGHFPHFSCWVILHSFCWFKTKGLHRCLKTKLQLSLALKSQQQFQNS